MTGSGRSFHREQRLAAIRRWAVEGVVPERERLPIEQQFLDRVDRVANPFFIPVALNALESVDYHRQVSYLLDAFDALPFRVDVAFDSAWKAFESASKRVVSGNITDRLKWLSAGRIGFDVIDHLCANLPVQSCEYLFKRLILDSLDGERGQRPRNRVENLEYPAATQLMELLSRKYGAGPPGLRRKGAMFLRKAVRGDLLTIDGAAKFQLDARSRAGLLMSGLLYSARNDRFHGESFSPFVSSAASLRTYTHPYFSFISSYYLLLCIWAEVHPEVIDFRKGSVLDSLKENLSYGIELFGSHWNR
ncbi:hypothetical protein [Myceligenerans indicum]|uniref:Uncharacterized protein n=1 Tax=Myceligenerans indicum TaxID=2593663 RepID=A0ABS1LKV7_9MICO|nr:hypothetical protein [Myceligenerans indicum]MBL0886885.1 hypothetical protein [Myceligenerans indicum]